MSITCVAILCVRNEALHIQRAVTSFVDQGIDVVIIDHESTDNTVKLCERFKAAGVLSIEHMPWTGTFDLAEQLKMKQRISETLNHDWIIHADADEWLQSPIQGETLLEGINRISDSGFNVINFEEFVFLPYREQELEANYDYYQKRILTYYFFAPGKSRLMRAWSRSSNLQNIESGGHKLSGAEINVAPESFILKHYLVMSYEHAIKKYVGRKFSERELQMGMHKKRAALNEQKLQLPQIESLSVISRWDSVELDRTGPKKSHFWDWH